MYTIAKMLNKNVKFADMNFDVLIPSLINEKTDLCIAAISITEEQFFVAYMNSLHQVLLPMNSYSRYNPYSIWVKT